MKRSKLNIIIKDAINFIEDHGYKLPPFAFWSPEDWRNRGSEYNEIRDNMLGWDITDFGSGDYLKVGLLMFTVRNGNYNMKKYAKPYAEKLLIVEEGQITPFHFHFKKMEDIINRAGGNLLIEVFNSTPEGEKAKTPVRVSIDGHNFEVAAGTVLKILPGESITLLPGQYHQFWAEAGKGKILLGEVSSVNDDTSDNRFYDNIGRFPVIDEDEPALYFLSNEYPSVI